MKNMGYFEKVYDIGTLEANTKKPFEIVVPNEAPKIVSIKASCGCTNIRYDKVNGVIKGIYRAHNLSSFAPDELISRKSILITYEDGTQERIFIHAKIKRKNNGKKKEMDTEEP